MTDGPLNGEVARFGSVETEEEVGDEGVVGHGHFDPVVFGLG